MNISTLTGTIELDDKYSTGLDKVMSKISAAEHTLEKFGQNAFQAGRSLSVAFTVPLVGAATASSVFAAKFETSMTRLVSLAGVSKDELEGVKTKIMELAPAVGVGPQELATAMTKISSTISDTNVALEILEISAKGSAAGLGEAVDVAGALTSVINSYGSENITAARAADILTKAVQDGGAEAKELAPTLANIVPLAAQLGISFEEVGANIATVTKLGVPAAEAVTQLSSVMSVLLKETKDGEEALASIGYTYEALRKSVGENGLQKTLADLMNRFGDNKAAITGLFGRIEGLRNIMSSAGQQAETYEKEMQRMTESAGSLEAAFKAVEGTTAHTWDQLISQTQVIAIQLGNALAPSLKEVLEAARPLLLVVQDLVTWFAALPRPVQTAVITVGALLAVAGPLLMIVGSMATGIATLIPFIGTLATGTLGLSISTGALMTTLTYLSRIPIVALVVALGFALYETTKAAKGFYDAVREGRGWEFITQRDTDNWVRRLIGLGDAANKARKDIKLPLEAGASSRLADSLSGVDVAKDVSTLAAAYKQLNPELLTNADVIKRVGERAYTLREQGGTLTPELNKMADGFKKMRDAAFPAAGALKVLTDEQEAYAKKLRAATDVMTGKAVANEMKFLAETVKMAGKEGGIAADQFKIMAKSVLEAVENGMKLEDLPPILRPLLDYQKQITQNESVAASTKFFLEKTQRGLNGALDQYKTTTLSLPEGLAAQVVLQNEVNTSLALYWEDIEKVEEQTAAAVKTTDTWNESLGALAASFANIAQISGGKFGGIVQEIGNIISAWDLAHKAVAAYKSAENLAQKAAAVVSGISSVAQATGSGSRASRVAGGAMTGFTLGNAILPGIGGVLGAIGGGAVGLIRSFFGAGESAAQKARKETEKLRNEFVTTAGGMETLSKRAASAGVMLGPLWNAQNPQQLEAAILKVNEALEAYDLLVETNKSRDEFIAIAGGLELLNQKAFDAGITLDRVLDAKTPEEYTAAVEDLNAALEFQDQAMQTLDRTLEKYNITAAEAGPLAALRMQNASALTLIQDYEVLQAAGMDLNKIIEKMAPNLQEYVSMSMKAGTTVPENMRVILQRMADLGLLTDDAGEKMTDLTGLTFAETLDTKFRTLIDSVKELVDAIKRGLSGAIADIPKPKAPWSDWPPPPEAPNYDNNEPAEGNGRQDPGEGDNPQYWAQGGRVQWRPKGTDRVPAMLTPGERVLSMGQAAEWEHNRGKSGGAGKVVVMLGPRQLAEILVPELPGVVTEYGVGI